MDIVSANESFTRQYLKSVAEICQRWIVAVDVCQDILRHELHRLPAERERRDCRDNRGVFKVRLKIYIFPNGQRLSTLH